MDLAITSQCNLRCKYCSHFTSSGDVGTDLPSDEWIKFFEELNKCTVMRLTLQGGEPFFRKDLKELINSIVKNQMRFSILSNGTLITDEWAAYLESTKRCDSVQVSIDGSVPVTHESFRGKGTFYKAINGIKFLQKNNVFVTVRVTIHKQNVHELDKIAKLLLEEIGLDSFSTNAASFMGLCRKNTKQVQLTTEERSLAINTLLNLNKKYDDRISADAGPLAEGNAWLQMKEMSKRKKKKDSYGGYLSGCGGVLENLAVRADGIIIPCIQLGHMELGRINKDNIKHIWQNHKDLKNLQNRSDIPLKNFKFCKNCEYINSCTGNCPAIAYTTFGDPNHPSPDACFRKFINEGGKLPK